MTARPSGDDAAGRHRDERRAAFEALAQRQQRSEDAEAAEASRLLAGFVERAHEQGLAPVRLRARRPNGGGRRYRTSVLGWYLTPDGSLAVDGDAQFYLLVTDGGVSALLRSWGRGVDVAPRPPRLAVGRGARDGESMSLQELLDRRLAAGHSFGPRR